MRQMADVDGGQRLLPCPVPEQNVERLAAPSGPALPTTLELAAVTLAMQRPVLDLWCPAAGRLTLLVADHQDDLDLATNLEIAAFRAAHFAFPGLDAPSYLNRWQRVSGDLYALLSIRFEGLDRSRPFVDLSGLSRPWTPADLPALGRAALEVFGVFTPRYLRLTSAAAIDAVPGLGRDRRFLAAPVSDLAGVQANIPPELMLRPTTDDRHHAQAAAAYATLDAQHPAHRQQAQILDADDLAECIQAGLMYDVLVGETWSGYVGVLPREKLGLKVYSVQELLLTPEVRGRGYGPHLTTLLARALLRGAEPVDAEPADAEPVDAESGRALFGTIHADNAGAYRAARQAGRLDVGGWVRLALSRS